MERLDAIVEEGQKINNGIIVPTVNERLALKVSILNIISKMSKDIFVMNRKLFYWKKSLINGEITLPESVQQYESGEFNENLANWLMEPFLIFCDNPEEVAREIADKLYEKKYKYVRARNDMYPTRLIVDVEFDIAAIINPTNKTISKHSDNVELFGANININGALMLPIFLYDYITPKFNSEQWKEDLEIEPFLWQDMVKIWQKGIVPYDVKKVELSEKIFEIIKTENEEDYVFTGYFTYHKLTNPKEMYNGAYHVYHTNPKEFMAKLEKDIEGLKVKEESQIYYFQSKVYTLTKDGEVVLQIIELDFPINYIKLGVYKHVNYHGLLLFLLLEALKAPLKDYNMLCGNIGYLVKTKNIFEKSIKADMLNKNGVDSVKNVFQILQNNSVGPDKIPFIDFKKKEFNRELTFFHRPDIVAEKLEDKSV